MKIKKKVLIFMLILFPLFLSINILSAQDLELNDKSEDFYFSDITLNAGRVAGVISCFLLGISIFIGGSSRLFDKIFGLNNILRFHRKITVFSFCILLLHVILITFSNVIEGISIAEFFSSYIGEIYFLAGIIAFFIFAIILLTSFLSKFINYIIWLTIHRLSIIAFCLSLYHLINFRTLTGINSELPFMDIFIDLGIIFAFSGCAIRIFFLFLKKKKYSVIIDLKKEINKVYTVTVKKPEGFIFKSGQFCFISFVKRGMRTPHPFIISSSPEEGILSFTINSLGKFAKKVIELKIGNKIKIDGPFGAFSFKKRDCIFIAGGIGITPFKSILGDKKNFIRGNKVKLIYSCKNKEDIIFFEWLEKLKEDKKYFPLDVTYILTREQNYDPRYNRINDIFLRDFININNDYYICTPIAMRKNIINILKKNNIKKWKIFHERYSW